MQNPSITFPYVSETSDGTLVYSGIVHIESGWMVIAYSPSRDRPSWTTRGGLTFEQAQDAAENEAVTWYDSAFPSALTPTIVGPSIA